jgi:hypothetical protein
MDNRMKLGAAVVSGYLLGRTKKGGAALRLAMWMTGNTGGPQVINYARQNVGQVLASDQAKEITQQLAGPMRQAIQDVVLATVMSRVQGINQNLAKRTDELNQLASNAGEKAMDTVSDATDTGTEAVGEATKPATDKIKKATNAVKPGRKSKESEPESNGDENEDEVDEDQPDSYEDQDEEGESRG